MLASSWARPRCHRSLHWSLAIIIRRPLKAFRWYFSMLTSSCAHHRCHYSLHWSLALIIVKTFGFPRIFLNACFFLSSSSLSSFIALVTCNHHPKTFSGATKVYSSWTLFQLLPIKVLDQRIVCHFLCMVCFEYLGEAYKADCDRRRGFFVCGWID
jgi:hypothetical protein